ncbi:ferritin-like protein [Mucilaginibacter sp.]|jgi:rubrerythrin|uniref:ferritin-like domain-containing protein n=1 Tax=Mucilaginibacter sp. TaxID=1882438 RepID=UPI0035655B93
MTLKFAQQDYNIKSSQLINAADPCITDAIAVLTNEARLAESAETRLLNLKTALQRAVMLEFATIPIYLSALWSIKDNLHPVAKSIRNVVQEEMLHLALASNMLASIGGVPKIYDPSENGLSYPTHLPGGVHPELFLELSGLTDKTLDDFLEIELPQDGVEFGDYPSRTAEAHAENETIGGLYDAINTEFKSLMPKMSPDKQVSGPLSWFVVDNVQKIDSAIHWIKEQGEGSIGNGPQSTGLSKLSHFYRFWEIRKRKKIEQDPATGDFFFGREMAFPEVWPMAVVPPGGYQKENVSPEVWELLERFDHTYSSLIKLLESAWGDGGQAALWKAIEVMFDLEKFALPLMQLPIPGGEGNYGPCFRLIPV